MQHRLTSILAMTAAVATVGCGADSSVRTYEERVIRAHDEAPRAAVPQHAAPASLSWTAPEGWDEVPGSGMRKATFFAHSGTQTGECSIVSFPGDVGGEAANLVRWAGQLGVTLSDEDAATFIEGAESFTTESGIEGRIYDFSSLLASAAPGTPSMLASILDRGNEKVFVKLMGPAALLADEKERFHQLSVSIR